VKVLAIRHTRDLRKPLKGFADVLLDNNVEIRDFRIMQEPGRRIQIFYPATVLQNATTGERVFKSLIKFPDQLKGELDLLILMAWEMERENESTSKQPK
jgi:hypothetical protein